MSRTTVKEITSFLETIAPLNYQEGYDNAGLVVGDPDMEITGVMTCLDSTEAVIEEAIEQGCNLVVAHHPIIFKGLKKINPAHYVQRVVIKAIKNDVAIYAIHTNLDNVFLDGVNTMICERLGLEQTAILAPKSAPSTFPEGTREQPIGSGMIGFLPEAMDEKTFLGYLKERMQVNCVRHTQLLNKPIKKVAVCGGAGSFLLGQAIRKEADIFITGDFKYHEFFDADHHLIIADIGHYESEQFTIDLLSNIIQNNFSIFAVRKTSVNTNPVHYF